MQFARRGGVIRHLSIPITMHDVSSSSQRTCAWLSWQTTCLTTPMSRVRIPWVPLRNTREKTVVPHYTKILGVPPKISHTKKTSNTGVAQRKSAVKHRRSSNSTCITSERLMVIALWAGGHRIETCHRYTLFLQLLVKPLHSLIHLYLSYLISLYSHSLQSSYSW